MFKKILSFFRVNELNSYRTKELNKGFTLLELLIVIAILATLATIVVIVLNPAETLAKSRDTQRLSDLTTLKSALALYLTSVSSPTLGGASNVGCKTATGYGANSKIYYSYPGDSPGVPISDSALDGGIVLQPGPAQVTNANLANIDSTGWIPVNFSSVIGGSPISSLPVDPINDIDNGSSSANAVTDEALVYRYACYSQGSNLSFEINANLESNAFTTITGADLQNNKERRDGGNNQYLLEAGNKLDILGNGQDF